MFRLLRRFIREHAQMACSHRKNKMKKGPKWNDDSVRALVLMLRLRITEVDGMTDERLDAECRRRVELLELTGKPKEVKVEALKEWYWQHVSDGGIGGQVTKVEKEREVTDIGTEVEKLVLFLKEHDTATEGGLKNTLFKDKTMTVFKEILEHGLDTGKIKRSKTTSGTEVITKGTL